MVYKRLLCLIAMFFSLHGYTVVIDPGHGGKYSGAQGPTGYLEKHGTLAIAKELEKALQSFKSIHSIILTRSDDNHLHADLLTDLSYRVTIATAFSADIFISIHLNGGSSAKRGYEIYIPFSTTFPKESYKLAAYIHHKLSQLREKNWSGTLGNMNAYDGGIRAAHFNVLRQQHCPAVVLLELDYITNSAMEKLLQDTNYQKQLAQIIAEGIYMYINNEKIDAQDK